MSRVYNFSAGPAVLPEKQQMKCWITEDAACPLWK